MNSLFAMLSVFNGLPPVGSMPSRHPLCDALLTRCLMVVLSQPHLPHWVVVSMKRGREILCRPP